MKLLTKAAFLSTYLLFAATPANAAEFKDKVVQAQFESGSLRLEYSVFGKGVWGGDELNGLYAQKRWEELVEGVARKRFVSDLYYFYLGAAAEALGHIDAAKMYYQMSVAAYVRGDSCRVGMDSCRTIPMPEASQTRIDAVQNAERPSQKMVKVVSHHGSLLSGVRIDTAGKRKGPSCTTDDTGTCKLNAILKPGEELPVTLSRPGMFVTVRTIPGNVDSETIAMRAYQDMLCDELRSSSASNQRPALERQIEQLDLRAQLDGATLEEGGICTSTFKRATYLSFKLKNGSRFNENKMTSYMIGATVFDDIVRKMLLQIVVTASDINVDGYDILVASTKGNFVDTSIPTKPVNFHFYFPTQLVAKYQDKDISGQQLLDGSIILLNDDRVDLKLQ